MAAQQKKQELAPASPEISSCRGRMWSHKGFLAIPVFILFFSPSCEGVWYCSFSIANRGIFQGQGPIRHRAASLTTVRLNRGSRGSREDGLKISGLSIDHRLCGRANRNSQANAQVALAPPVGRWEERRCVCSRHEPCIKSRSETANPVGERAHTANVVASAGPWISHHLRHPESFRPGELFHLSPGRPGMALQQSKTAPFQRG